MVKEIVQAISGTHVITDSGTKVPIGNKNFDVGEAVWVDGEYVFGDEPNSQPTIIGEGPGEVGNYLVLYKSSGQWIIFDVDKWTYKTISDNLALSSKGILGLFYNTTGTKFCLIASDTFTVPSIFTYYELSQNGLIMNSIDVSVFIN